MSKIFAYRCKTIWTMQPDCPWLDNGMIIIEKDKIVDVGKYTLLKKNFPPSLIKDLGEISLIPGLINIHTHLELSHVHNKTTLGQGFTKWLKSLIPWLIIPIGKKRIKEVINELKSFGIVAVGDITSRKARDIYCSLKEAEIEYCLFVEFLGSKKKIFWPKGIEPQKDPFISITAHSPYSVSKELLLKCKAWSRKYKRAFVIHLAESQEEVDFLMYGKGEFGLLLKKLLPKNFVPPGLHPVEYVNNLGLLDKNTIAVHCVHVSENHIKALKETGCYVCICPRSNFFIGVGRAPWEKMYEAGIPLCLATDGLCSNKDLNLWNEVEFLINTSKIELTLFELLKMITINPAQAAHLDGYLGTISKGKKALFSSIPPKIEELFKHSKRYI